MKLFFPFEIKIEFSNRIIFVSTIINCPKYKVVPFAYALMSKKTELAYKAVFGYIHNSVMKLNCEIFMSDYERALRNGLSAIIPNLKTAGCWFHFSQAIKRFARKLSELMEFFKEDPAAKQIYFELLALPLLPAASIVAAFQKLKERAFALNKEAFKRFIHYFENQWIKKVHLSVIRCHFQYQLRNFVLLFGHMSILDRNSNVFFFFK